MNTKTKLALSLGWIAAPLAMMAKTPEKAYVESYHGRTGIPVPVTVVTPDVDARYAGTRVVLEFVVDATGKPTAIAPASKDADPELVAAITAAVAQWQFAPAVVNGKPVARKVELPVNVVDSFDSATRYAMK